MAYTHKQNPVQQILDAQAKPTPLFAEFLDFMGICHNGSLQDIVRSTQEEWLRKPGQERWHLQDTDEYKEKREIALQYLHRLGVVEEVVSPLKEYDYAILLGATLARVTKRVEYLYQLWLQGIRFKKLVILSGERPLDGSIEKVQDFINAAGKTFTPKFNWQPDSQLPTTEVEMMKWVVDQSMLKELLGTDVEVQIISVPMKPGEHGKLLRPTTADTVEAFLATQPTPGTCLSVSNQPYVIYQDSVLQALMPATFTVYTVGEKSSNLVKLADHLDNLARFLYQEKIRLNV